MFLKLRPELLKKFIFSLKLLKTASLLVTLTFIIWMETSVFQEENMKTREALRSDVL